MAEVLTPSAPRARHAIQPCRPPCRHLTAPVQVRMCDLQAPLPSDLTDAQWEVIAPLLPGAVMADPAGRRLDSGALRVRNKCGAGPAGPGIVAASTNPRFG